LQLNFKAFVQATPDAVAKKSVQPGEYTSVANFELFYE
ncbi:type 1 fimbrial protein, partial [Salmonella enterica]|nr:type 1 fimbrial protein [Salmonella enterica]